MQKPHYSGEIIANRYRILDILGSGGSGIMYRAENLATSEQIALKALSIHHIGDWKNLELFEREAQILSQLDYPAIPRYLEYFHIDTETDRYFYIAQQLAPGKSLATLVENGWRARKSEVKHIAIQLLNILIYLHGFDPPVIHRDIKPQNLIRSQDGKVFLVDFGAVQNTYHSTLARGSTVVGTFGYMAPEQFIGQAVPATDLYGLGATLLFLLTHRSPADLPKNRLEINFRSQVNISEAFAQWLQKMLASELSERFKSADSALTQLSYSEKISTKISYVIPKKLLIGVGAIAACVLLTMSIYRYLFFYNYPLTVQRVCLRMEKGDVKTLKHYLEQGGNPNEFVEIMDFLDDQIESQKYLPECSLKAPNSEQLEMVKLLIDAGADVNLRDYYGYERTLLHFTTDPEIAKLLITAGADINPRDNDGKTPLGLALQRSSELSDSAQKKQNNELIELLKSYGATE